MNPGYGGMPSRRRIRGPLHPAHRAPPSSSQQDGMLHQDGAGPSTGQKRGWTSTIRSGATDHRPMPWDQPSSHPSVTTSLSASPTDTRSSPSTSFASASVTAYPHAPRSDFVFQSGMQMPFHGPSSFDGGVQRSAENPPRDASSHSLPASNSQTAFSTTSAGSPASFRTATELEPQVAAHGTISSRGMPSAQQALLQEQRKTAGRGAVSEVAEDEHHEGPPSKRRRGLAGTIVDTALNAALYTGAAALTAYSLWSTWGKRADGEAEEPDGGPVLPSHKTLPEKHLPPGGLDEPPPPYPVYDLAAGPSTPKSPANARKQRVFVSAQRNRRRPTFQSHRATQSSGTPRKAIPDAFRSTPPAQEEVRTEGSGQSSGAAGHGDDEDDDDEDGMFQRFQDKMNALIAQGQAALESKPSLDAMDFDQDDLGEGNGPGFALSSSNSAPSLGVADQAGQHGRAFSNRTVSMSWYEAGAPSSGMVQSQSQPSALYSQGSPAYYPEPIKRSHPSGGANTPGRRIAASRSSAAAWQSPSTDSSSGTPSRRTSMLPRPSASLNSRRATGYAPR
ncbi:uncharacterized protein PFL1_00825 [Pseudozyma flocculosa PF-1]|uniref:uncharacterized protein n=1 Tax=Pseudozyma flocculosa PF-1 TaxID=1277687 RepID=UPI0004560069|nr:uncharacterized protein PFL1_00825 [Pseudozyma flocculosa PF-1]EPQ31490.1 hypothetical protein PFL1_00825 [Pseudozyma flocculosa PF-1]